MKAEPAPPAATASPQAASSAPRLRAGEFVSMPTAATLPAPAASQGPVALPWKSDRLPLIIGAAGHRDLREGDLAKLKSAVASVISTLRRQYLGNDKQTPIVLLSALGEGAEQLIAGEALKQGVTLIVPLPLPLSEYRRDFTQRPLAPDAIKHFDDLRHKATATVEIPLAAGSTESGVRAFGPERDRQYREANLFIARHCHVLIALYDGNDDDITVGGAAETVKFNRDGIPGGIRESAYSALDGAEIGPVIHIVTPRKAVKTTASEVRLVPWGTKAKGASQRGLGAKKPLDLTVEEARAVRAWAEFRAVATLTSRFNREAKARARKREVEIAKGIARLFGGNAEAQARAETTATQWSRFYGLADTLAREREKRVRGDWRDMFLLSFAALLCFALYSHLFPVNLLLFDYAAILAVVFIIFFRARLRAHRQRFLDYRALAEALRVGVFWRLLGIGTEPPSAPSAPPQRISVARAYPMSQPNELAWVQAALRGLDLADRIALPLQAPRVALDAYGWTREFWVGAQREFYRALEARCGRIAEQRQRWGMVLLIASAVLAAALSATDIYDEMSGRASTIMAMAERSAAFITDHASFLPAWATTFVNQFAAQTYPVLVFIIAVLPGLAAAIVGYAMQMSFRAQSRYCAQMAWRFERALEMLPEPNHVGRKSIMAGFLEPELSAHCQAFFTELGTATMRSSAEWVAIHRDHVVG
jgi:Flp pilus assembly protein TadB